MHPAFAPRTGPRFSIDPPATLKIITIDPLLTRHRGITAQYNPKEIVGKKK